MKTISLPVYNRPDALKLMLESLSHNNTEGWILHVSLDACKWSTDPVFGALTEFSDASGMDYVVHPQRNKLGLTLNTFLAPSLAFAAGSDFNLYLEDDLILSPDALDLCNWYEQQLEGYNNNSSRLGMGLALWRHQYFTGREAEVSKGQGGHGNGFCCNRAQWEAFWRKEWFSYGQEGGGRVWDIATDVALRTCDTYILSPFYPRSVQQRVDGTHGKASSTDPLCNVPIYQGPRITDFKLV